MKKEEIKKQKNVIQNNFNAVINSTDENQKDKLFNLFPLKQTYFKDLVQDDVELQF